MRIIELRKLIAPTAVAVFCGIVLLSYNQESITNIAGIKEALVITYLLCLPAIYSVFLFKWYYPLIISVVLPFVLALVSYIVPDAGEQGLEGIMFVVLVTFNAVAIAISFAAKILLGLFGNEKGI